VSLNQGTNSGVDSQWKNDYFESVEHLPIFVYGTLQRGECRATLWPCVPTRVETAFTRGRLFDLGPYPALLPGEDLVRGELWHVAKADFPRTTHTLDAIEGYLQPDQPDWYVRKTTDCYPGEPSAADSTTRAWVYYFASPDRLAVKTVVPVGTLGYAWWKRGGPVGPDD